MFPQGFGFGVSGFFLWSLPVLGLRVSDVGFLSFCFECSGFRVQGFGFWVSGIAFECSGFRAQGLGFGVSGLVGNLPDEVSRLYTLNSRGLRIYGLGLSSSGGKAGRLVLRKKLSILEGEGRGRSALEAPAPSSMWVFLTYVFTMRYAAKTARN